MANSEKNTKAFYNTEIPSDWEVIELGKLVDEKRPVSYGIVQTGKLVEGGIKCIRVTDIVDGKIDTRNLITTSKKISDSYKRTILRKGDLVMALRGKIGQIAKINEDLMGANLTRGVALIAVKDLYDNDFLRQQISSENAIKVFERSLNGSALQELSIGTVRKIPILLPKSLPEQRAIAHFLGLMDNVINKNNQLIAQKEKRKKWLMQQLLTGKKRLKGFEGEWEEYKLGQLGDYYNGLTGKTKEDFGQGAPFITYMNVFSNSKIDINQVDYVNLTENDNQNSAKYGDIFFTVSSEIPNEVGMAAVLLDEVDQLFLNSFCFGFRLFNFESLHPKYAQYILRFDSFRESMILLAQGSTRFNISKSAVCQIKLNLPNIEEQLEIVNILTAADKEIGLLKAKADKLKEQKKGMMQVLLTGKKRLKIQ